MKVSSEYGNETLHGLTVSDMSRCMLLDVKGSLFTRRMEEQGIHMGISIQIQGKGAYKKGRSEHHGNETVHIPAVFDMSHSML